MKLLRKKPVVLNTTTEAPKEETKPKRKSGKNKLPSDEYKDLVKPTEIVLNDSGKLVVSLKRGGELGLPRCDIRFFATTDVYTGFTKSGVNFDLDKLPELKAILCDMIEEADSLGLFEDFEAPPEEDPEDDPEDEDEDIFEDPDEEE